MLLTEFKSKLEVAEETISELKDKATETSKI